jgi:hypothetical protein
LGCIICSGDKLFNLYNQKSFILKKSTLIRITIIAALLTQVSHASEVFYLLSKQEIFDKVMSWVFAISLELSIFIFTIFGKKRIAVFFGVISCLINLLVYWFEAGFTQNFVGMLIISPIIPITIYFYSELINEENRPKMGRPKKQ